MRTRRYLAVIALLACVAACGDMKAIFGLLGALQKEYHLPTNVNVTNGARLDITFQNVPASRFADSLSQAAFALQAAQFAKAHYANANTLREISVRFATVNSVGPVTVTRNDSPYVFAVRDLK